MSSSSHIPKLPLSALPLPPTTHTLTHNLTPDPHTPSPSSLRKVQSERPSIQRRARLLSPQSHFSYVVPYPMPFPFRIVPEEGEEVEDQAAFIEAWLAKRESVHANDKTSPEEGADPLDAYTPRLKKYYPKHRDQPLELLGLSETGLRDCLPHLHVGDAFDVLGSPTLVPQAEEHSTLTETSASEEDVAARQELIDVLSGHAALMSVDVDAEQEGEKGWAPWSLRYSGHQFGNWAGQLGDGRAISILATPHPTSPHTIYELQLKGSGRTPFSRSADGLAVVRSSIREFLASEAMHALRIPTTRSLSLISLPQLPVLRESLESACVLTRMAPSFLRIGSFEALSPPERMFFLGGLGGQQEAHWEGLRVLGEWVGRRVLELEGVRWREDGEDRPGDAWGKELVLEVARRNARMVAGWQAYGFMHGVINTDNVSVLGLTIDYGPYAFMDVFDFRHVCNHSDGEGRYAYDNQPNMVLYAIQALTHALAPLIGAELSSSPPSAVRPGWADDASQEVIDGWREKGLEAVEGEVKEVFRDVCAGEYSRLMHRRLGLKRMDKDDESRIARPLLEIMDEHKLDFHGTFRRLGFFRPSWIPSSSTSSTSTTTTSASSTTPSTSPEQATSPDLEAYITSLLSLSPAEQLRDEEKARRDLRVWLGRYAERIRSEADEWASPTVNGSDAKTNDSTDIDTDTARRLTMHTSNPRFVLRQWVLEEVIKRVEADPLTGRRVLRKVLRMACEPFAGWGGEEGEVVGSMSKKGEVEVEGVCGRDGEEEREEREERRLCGVGERGMLGFQCSCSS